MGRKRISNNNWISAALIVILAILIFFAPSYGWKVREWLSPLPPQDTGATSTASNTDDQTLATENDELKAQLAELQTVASQLPTSSPDTVRAMVYSRYPMNFRNELLLSAGSGSGVAVGDAVVFQGMLIGQVRSVYPGESLVQTIFDDGFKMPVRIGAGGASGLLQGGSDPEIGSIPSTASIGVGDAVYSAASGMPYALPIAQVVSTSTSADNLFQQAAIAFPYDINNIQTVLIVQ